VLGVACSPLDPQCVWGPVLGNQEHQTCCGLFFYLERISHFPNTPSRHYSRSVISVMKRLLLTSLLIAVVLSAHVSSNYFATTGLFLRLTGTDVSMTPLTIDMPLMAPGSGSPTYAPTKMHFEMTCERDRPAIQIPMVSLDLYYFKLPALYLLEQHHLGLPTELSQRFLCRALSKHLTLQNNQCPNPKHFFIQQNPPRKNVEGWGFNQAFQCSRDSR
jgi:hypothetical protein